MMNGKIIRCQNKECVWWEDYTCSKKEISLNKEGICIEVVKKKIIMNNQAK